MAELSSFAHLPISFGTLPFAGLARCGFVAVQYLRAFQSQGIISRTEFCDFMASLNTVTKRLSMDVEKFHAGIITQEEFLKTYGHLRPGTYDVLSARYDEAFGLYFNYNIPSAKPSLKRRECDEAPTVEPVYESHSSLSRSDPVLDHHSLHPNNPVRQSPLHPFSKHTLENICNAFNSMGLKSPTPVVLKFLKEAIEGMTHL